VENKDSEVDEYLKKLEDPKFFIESCLSIIDKDSCDVPLFSIQTKIDFTKSALKAL